MAISQIIMDCPVQKAHVSQLTMTSLPKWRLQGMPVFSFTLQALDSSQEFHTNILYVPGSKRLEKEMAPL